MLLATAGCASELDTTRQVTARGTLGEEIFAVLRKDVARSARAGHERRLALDEQRDSLVRAIDGIVPAAQRGPLDDLLVGLVDDGAYDDGTLPRLTRSLATELRGFGNDAALLKSWAWASQRDASRLPRDTRLLAHLAGFEQLRALTDALVGYALAHDGLGPSGAADPAESRLFAAAVDTLGRALQEVDPGDGPDDRLLDQALELLLVEDTLLEVDALPLWMVRRDLRGVPLVRTSPSGEVPPPFVDENGDGLADVDALGRFVDAAQQIIDLPPHVATQSPDHDGLGRALLPGAEPDEATGEPPLAYVYTDVHRTVLRALLEDARPLLEADLLFRSAPLLPALASDGHRVQRIDGGARWEAFDTAAASPLLDLFWAFMQIAAWDELPALLELGARLLGDPSLNAAGLIHALDALFELADRHEEAVLAEGHTFQEEILAWLGEVASVPGLLTAVLEEAEHIDWEELQRAGADMLNFADAQVTEAEAESCGRAAFCAPLTVAVDRTRPDVETHSGDPTRRTTNRSLFQRALHLVGDTFGQPYSLSPIGDGEIFATSDLASFYFDIVGGLGRDEPAAFPGVGCVGELLSAIAPIVPGVRVDPCPTAEQAGRFMNRALFDSLADQEVMCREGYFMRLHHGDTLFALVFTGTADALQPLARAFSRHGRTDLLAGLFALLHRHWGTPEGATLDAHGQPSQSSGTGLVRYEPLLVELLTQSDFVRELMRATRALAEVTLAGGRPAGDLVAALLVHLLVPDPLVRRRDGTSAITLPDGSERGSLSRFELLAEALDGADAALQRDDAVAEAWEHVSETLIEHFLDTAEAPDGGRFELVRPSGTTVGAHLLQVVQPHAARWLEKGVLHETLLAEWPADLEETLQGQGAAALVDLFTDIAQDGVLRGLLQEAALHLIAPEQLDQLALVAFDLLHDAYEHHPSNDHEDARGWVAAAHAFGRLLTYRADGAQLPFQLLNVLQRTMRVDGAADRVGDLLRQALAENGRDRVYRASVLGRAWKRDHRRDPSDASPYDDADYAQMLSLLADYLLDEQTGAEKLYALIADRL